MEEKTLRLCPCCGETHEFELEPIAEQNDDGYRRVRCQCCDLATQWVSPKEDYTAEMLWNKRPIEKDQELQIGALYVALAKTRAVLDEAVDSLRLEGIYHPIEVLVKSLDGNPSTPGIAMIAAERMRQIEKEGYDAKHDSKHLPEQLADAGAAYARGAFGYNALGKALWPFDECYYKPSLDPVQNLKRAGALIAAAIDRIQAE